ncbi:MAG: F0F1 ATP synthase subunit B [Rhodospirillaceae bacterium]|nr:F0F1 ATP synthase subunit B [Rhodospirillaceae bacterium]
MLENPGFWVGVGFFLFIAVTAKKVHTMLSTMLDGRAEKIRQELDETQKLREDAQAVLADYQRRQRDAIQEAEQILAHATEEAARLRTEAAANLETTLKRREEQAVEKIAAAEAQALKEVRDQAVDLAIQATGKLIADNMTDEVGSRLTKAAIDELPTRLQ